MSIKSNNYKLLTELVRVVNRKRISKVNVLDKTFLNSTNTNLYYKLYDALEKEKVSSDEEAGKLLYDTGSNDARYYMLKSRLKDKLLKSVLLFDSDEVFNNERGKAYYDSLTFNQTLEIIIQLTGTTKLVYDLVKENYAIPLRFGFYDILKNYSYYLIAYYALKGDKKSLLSEEQRYLTYIDLARKEQLAKHYYMRGIVDFVGHAKINTDTLNEVKKNLDRLIEIKSEIQNTEIDFYYFYLALTFYERCNEIEKIIIICDEADSLMEMKSEAITSNRKATILLYRLRALLALQKYEYALGVLNSFESKYLPNDTLYNWYLFKEIEFKLYFQDHNLKEAYNICEKVISNRTYNRQVEQLTEKWKIYHAYLVFLDNYLHKGDFKKFSLSKFLNSVPVNSKDKSGFNFAIRVIELMYLLARRQLVQVYNKMDALRVYRSRYLKDITYKRNHLFLSLLLKAEKFGFDGRLLHKADWQEIQDLRDRKHIIAEWEIIPYEELWDIFVDLSKK